MVKYFSILMIFILASSGCKHREVNRADISSAELNREFTKYQTQVIKEIDQHFEYALHKALEEYVKIYKEEVLLTEMLAPFLYPRRVNEEDIMTDKFLEPLYDVLVKKLKTGRPIFAPIVSVMTFHYPKHLKTITLENCGEIDFVGVLPQDQISELGSPHSVLKVIERGNNNEDSVITASCGFLVIIKPFSTKLSPQTPHLVWLYCQCKWNPETKTWLIKEAKELSRGEIWF